MLKNNDEMFNKGVIWAKNVIFYNDIIFGSVAKKVGNPCEARFPSFLPMNRFLLIHTKKILSHNFLLV